MNRIEELLRKHKPCWEKDPDCKWDKCNVHPGKHVMDCPCPELIWWEAVGMDPYTTNIRAYERKMLTP
jgi:hypothetical protein